MPTCPRSLASQRAKILVSVSYMVLCPSPVRPSSKVLDPRWGAAGSVFRIKPGLLCLAFDALQSQTLACFSSLVSILPLHGPRLGSSQATRWTQCCPDSRLGFGAFQLLLPVAFLCCYLHWCTCLSSPCLNVSFSRTANSFPCLSSLHHKEYPLPKCTTLWFAEHCPPTR